MTLRACIAATVLHLDGRRYVAVATFGPCRLNLSNPGSQHLVARKPGPQIPKKCQEHPVLAID